jgi:hypothetical protein
MSAKFHLSGKNLGVVAPACHPSYSRKHKTGDLWSRLASAKSKTLSPKITRAKRAGGMAQAVEHLSSKCQALSSNTSTGGERGNKKELTTMAHTCKPSYLGGRNWGYHSSRPTLAKT